MLYLLPLLPRVLVRKVRPVAGYLKCLSRFPARIASGAYVQDQSAHFCTNVANSLEFKVHRQALQPPVLPDNRLEGVTAFKPRK